MPGYRKQWWALIAVVMVTFAVLGLSGVEVYRKVPPIPARIVSESGTLIATREEIIAGQAAWQSTGGMELGSIWGHGAYQAPDWSADWLHRELTVWLQLAAHETQGKAFDALTPDEKSILTSRLRQEYRRNTLDPATGAATVSDRRAQAIAQTASWYERLYGADPAFRPLRKDYAMKEATLPDPAQRKLLARFFFW